MKKKQAADVKATKIPKPKRPKVDRGEGFEQLVRQMFKGSVGIWCKENLDEQPDKEEMGGVVDNLTATWTSALETVIDAATDNHLCTVSVDDDEDEDDDEEDEDDEDEDEDEDE
jgi:hypothetical protein